MILTSDSSIMYNFDNSIYRIIFILLRAGLNWTTIPRADWNECQKILNIDWDAIYKECVRHGVLAIAWEDRKSVV